MLDIRRIKNLNQKNYPGGAVVYKMSREHRADDNWGLLHAQDIANAQHVPLYVIYTYQEAKWNMVEHSLGFMLGGLKEVQEQLKEKNISFTFIITKNSASATVDFCKEVGAGLLVTDHSTMRPHVNFNVELIDKIKKDIDKTSCIHKMSFDIVDGHNIIPVWEVSEKLEFAARTIRPKIYKKVGDFLKDFKKLEKNENNNTHFVAETFKNTDWDYIYKTLKSHMKIVDQISSHTKVTKDKSGYANNYNRAHDKLKDFLENKLSVYDEKRNDANADGQSGLSAHVMWGHIGIQRIALETLKSVKLPIEKVLDDTKNGSGDKVFLNKNASAFLEELIVRGSLSENFCHYNVNYDNFAGLANWAQEALNKARTDKREYVYTLDEFENARTHDELWNAAQIEMIITGRMHGYMRMYWAKKILEWTKNPEQAIEYAIYLNDKYELDGWSPNGYAGVLWSIGGLHDRAWFPRPVYGTIRYMARSGCEKKFDVKKYIKSHTFDSKLFLE